MFSSEAQEKDEKEGPEVSPAVGRGLSPPAVGRGVSSPAVGRGVSPAAIETVSKAAHGEQRHSTKPPGDTQRGRVSKLRMSSGDWSNSVMSSPRRSRRDPPQSDAPTKDGENDEPSPGVQSQSDTRRNRQVLRVTPSGKVPTRREPPTKFLHRGASNTPPPKISSLRKSKGDERSKSPKLQVRSTKSGSKKSKTKKKSTNKVSFSEIPSTIGDHPFDTDEIVVEPINPPAKSLSTGKLSQKASSKNPFQNRMSSLNNASRRHLDELKKIYSVNPIPSARRPASASRLSNQPATNAKAAKSASNSPRGLCDISNESTVTVHNEGLIINTRPLQTQSEKESIGSNTKEVTTIIFQPEGNHFAPPPDEGTAPPATEFPKAPKVQRKMRPRKVKKVKKEKKRKALNPEFKTQFKQFAKYGDKRNTGKVISLCNSDKWLKQAGVIDGKKVASTDTEIYFIYHSRRKRSLSPHTYTDFLRTLAEQKNLKMKAVMDKMINCGIPLTCGISSTNIKEEGDFANVGEQNKEDIAPIDAKKPVRRNAAGDNNQQGVTLDSSKQVPPPTGKRRIGRRKGSRLYKFNMDKKVMTLTPQRVQLLTSVAPEAAGNS